MKASPAQRPNRPAPNPSARVEPILAIAISSRGIDVGALVEPAFENDEDD
jgi:hypothetical protein